jgi:hypothetical protein
MSLPQHPGRRERVNLRIGQYCGWERIVRSEKYSAIPVHRRRDAMSGIDAFGKPGHISNAGISGMRCCATPERRRADLPPVAAAASSWSVSISKPSSACNALSHQGFLRD